MSAAISRGVETGQMNIIAVWLLLTLQVSWVLGRCDHYGKYQNSKANVMGCSAGYYCSGTGQQWAWTGTCKQCESGWYCPGGRGIDYKRENAAPKFPCPAGKWVRELGKAECNACPSGKYSTLVGAYYSADCKSCPKGKYMSGTGASVCTDCDRGKYSTSTGQVASSTCKGCPVGTYVAGTGATTCVSCPKGTYMTSIGASICTPCSSGKYSISVKSSTEAKCVNCPAGKANPSSGATTCTSCVKGKYMASTGASVCTNCSGGKSGITVGATIPSKCVSCKVGKYMDQQGSTACKPCLKGRYSSQTGFTECEPCGQGKYTGSLGAIKCSKCPAGKYSTAVGATASSFCISCSTGKFSAAEGSTDSSVCEDCSPGTYSTTIAATSESKCLRCGKGTFNPSTGASSAKSCVPCAIGKFNNDVGAISCEGCSAGKYLSSDSSVNECLDCAAGRYSEGGTTTCSACPVGRYSKSPGAPLCTLCGPGTFTDLTGQTKCLKQCPAGTFSTDYGSSSNDDCTKCAAGTFQFLAGSSTCMVCSPGSYSGEPGQAVCSPCEKKNTYSDQYGQTACKDCPEGKVATTKGAVGCTVPLPCPGGSYSDSGLTPCNLCPPGKTSTSASGSMKCKECPAGSITESSGQASCRLCNLQEVSLESRDGCVACESNSIPDPSNKFKCKRCPEGEVASLGECSVREKCGPGEFSISGYGPECQSCPAGTYGSTSGSTACALCPYGAYTDSVGNVYPTFCPDNTYTATNGSIHIKECIQCQGDTIASADRSECTLCGRGEYASGGQCLKKLSTAAQDAVGGVFANKGLPFYILVILLAGIASFSLLVFFSKEKHADVVLKQTMLAHVAQHVMPCAGLISEMILCVAVLQVGLSSVRAYGIMLLLARVLVAVTPGLVVVYAIFGNTTGSIAADGTKHYSYWIMSDILTANGKTYITLLFLSILEPPLLSFLPWFETPFSKVAMFPTIGLMKLCYLFKFLQLLVTLSAQIGLLATQTSDASSTFGIIVILNLTFTLIVVVTKSSEMAMKISLLSGRVSVLSDDCNAARKASALRELEEAKDGGGASGKGDEREGADADAEEGLEFGTIYQDNPLHSRNSMPDVRAAFGGATDESASERVALLGDMEKTVQQHTGLLQDLRSEVESMRNQMWAMTPSGQDSDAITSIQAGDSSAQPPPPPHKAASADNRGRVKLPFVPGRNEIML